MAEVPLRRVPPVSVGLLTVEWVRRALAVSPPDLDSGTRLALQIADAAEALALDPGSEFSVSLLPSYRRWVERNLSPIHPAHRIYESCDALAAVIRKLHCGWDQVDQIKFYTDARLYFWMAQEYISVQTSRPVRRVAGLQHRTAHRAKSLTVAQLKRLPELRTPIIVSLARKLWHSRAAIDGAVLADALEEAGLATAVAAPYRAEPESLTRADWLFWHLGCRDFGGANPT